MTLRLLNAGVPAFDDEWKFMVGLWLRVVSASVFLLFLGPFTILGIDFPYAKCFVAYYGLVGLILVNLGYWMIGRVRGFPITDFYAHWAVDLVLITMVMYGLGGCLLPSSITAYILIVITSAVFISRRASYGVATGAAFAYGGSIAAEAAGWIDPAYDLGLPEFSAGMKALVIGGPVFMVYLVAFITGTLGDQLNAANELLRMRNEELRERNASLDRTRSELDFQSKVLTHDIRTPVAAALGALGEVERERSLDETTDNIGDLVGIAARNLGRVEDMIEALDRAREGLEWTERFGPVDLAEVMEELSIEFGQEITRCRAALVVEKKLPTVIGRRERFVVMLRNLIGNALRYVPRDGSGRIRIGIREYPREWRIFVEDNGCGVPVEFQTVIFEMFRKAPQREKAGGMGVGLALVKKVAQQHGGRAWVESDGRTGATFWVCVSKEQGMGA
jgi:signal transduction histidine kinase